jgi:Leucine Rich repeat
VVTDLELDTIALLAGLEELNVGFGVALGAPRPKDLGPADGEAECRIAGGTRITDLGVAKLAKLKKLKRLDLSGSTITSTAVKTLAALPQLQRLSLWNAQGIDDGAAPHLEALNTLTSLDLSDTAVGDATLVRLATLPNLRRLYVNETKVTPDGVTAFHAKRPACVISSGSRPAPRIPLTPGTQDAR